MSTKLIARDQCLAPGRVGGSVYGGRYGKLFDGPPATSWRPTLPSHEAGIFGIADLLVPAE